MKLYKFINYKFINYKFLRTHKLILGILVIIIFGVFLFYNPIIEGLTSKIGEYEFLAPPTDIITDDMWNKLNEKMKKTYNKPDITLDQVKSSYTNLVTNKYEITNKEINYYLENGKFPVDQYVINAFKEYMKKDNASQTDSASEDYIQKYSMSMTNRQIFSMVIDTLPNKNSSEGYLIYMGTKPPPSYSSPTISLTDAIPSLNEIDNKRNYNDLVSLCKRVR